MKKFPIGIATLQEIVENGYYYVDKTKFIAQMATSGKYYFLSRPRRFGKSLIVDALKQAFLGNKELFKGLYLETNWDWSVTYPVIHISFASNEASTDPMRLEQKILDILEFNGKNYGISINRKDLISTCFTKLIDDLYNKYNGKVVILVDEYDKPILDAITDVALAEKMRSVLSSFYSVLKEFESKIKFVFFTGVSKFAKAGIFSGLNNLRDITYLEEYATICGYTQEELETTFAEHLQCADLPKIKEWYNGYNFMGDVGVYNPFSILNFLASNKNYANYWFESGTPSFLINLIQKHRFYIPDLENIEVTGNDLSSFEIERIQLVILLLQTGYLTFKGRRNRGSVTLYKLGYPNLEVKQSLNDCLADIMVDANSKSRIYDGLGTALEMHDFSKFGITLNSIFAAIPYHWYQKNGMGDYEGFYCATVYCYLMGLGYHAIAEDVTSQGRIDITLILDDSIVILEFKLKDNGDAKVALEQIKTKGYAAKYVQYAKPIYLVGISFDPKLRNVYDVEFEMHV